MGSDPDKNAPKIGAVQIRLLEKLTNSCAVSGDESEVRQIVLEQIRTVVDEFRVDSLGNVLAIKRGKGENRLKALLAAHMDEVGFILTADDGDGIFRFDLVGGVDERLLPGKPVWVGKEHLPGVIGAKPIHLTDEDDRRSAISLESMRIDIGPGNGSKAKIGERATFATQFSRSGSSLRAKALDDRLGVVNLIELLKHPPENIDLLAAFTVQEEVGLRGAGVAAYALEPDLAIALDSTPANDLPAWDGSENTRYNTRLGAGAAIYVADRGTLYDTRLVRHFIESAEKFGIAYQIRQPGGGSTDAAAIHKRRMGIPSLAVSVPARYNHTPAAIARLSDWKDTLALVYAALVELSLDRFKVEG